MKNISLLGFILLFSTSILAQELKRITRTPDSFTTEEFYVLKTDKKVKHGLYRKTVDRSQMVEEGYYKLGKRDSLWKTSYRGLVHKIGSYKDDQKQGVWITYGRLMGDKPVLRDSGAYDMENKVGLWKYYDREGKPDLIYDYDKKEKIFQKQDSLVYFFISGKDTLANTLDHSPIYSDGTDQFYYIIAHSFRLPRSFFSKPGGFKNKVYISFFINENGDMEELKAISKTDKDLNKQAILAVLATNKTKWIPGIYQGEPVKTQVIIPFDITNYGIR